MASNTPDKQPTPRIDPTWPEYEDGTHPVSELASPLQGGLSPFGETSFPLSEDALDYTHPVTKINR